MDKMVFKEIIDKLDGLNYFFISGLSVAIYTNGERIPGDMDVVVHRDDIDKFAERLGTKVEKRHINKGTFIVDDYGFQINYKGQAIECSFGYPIKRINEDTFDKLFNRKFRAKYLGQTVFVEPIEELVNQKAFMHREKDINDLKLLKDNVLDKSLFLELSNDKGNLKEVLPIVKQFFNISL